MGRGEGVVFFAMGFKDGGAEGATPWLSVRVVIEGLTEEYM